ncbi:MAG TPA: prolyl oligopeptidase family serine peptidase [Streptosporangiaceae bacterium]|jgi:dipeptidyl-peptidase-4
MADTFPRQHARTRRFSLGVPRSFRISPDGARIVFLRSKSGLDQVGCLWQYNVGTGQEHLVADPAVLIPGGEQLDPAERARRERSREQAAGIVSFATDAQLRIAAFALSGQVYVADLTGQHPVRQVSTPVPAADPRPDPAGQRIAYLHERALRMTDLGTGEDTAVAEPGDTPDLAFGVAEFVAAEEIHRMRGYWWAPDGSALLLARVDDSGVQRWHIADPANPGQPATAVRYPSAGTPNSAVSLLIAGRDGSQVPVDWDAAAFPYLVTVSWERGGPDGLLLVVQSRDQKQMRLLAADPRTGATTLIRADTDPHWLEVVPGVPGRTSDGKIVWIADSGGARRLLVATAAEHAAGAAEPVTPPALQVREVLDVDGEVVLFTATQQDPTQARLWTYGPTGLNAIPAPDEQPRVQTGRLAGGTLLTASRTAGSAHQATAVLRDGSPAGQIAAHAQEPLVPAPRPDIFRAGERQIVTALLLPSWHQPGSAKLPVLVDPYGGPHMQRVMASGALYLTSQWLAEQGFAVLIADGRGTPGRGPRWEREIAGDMARPVLEDQVDALAAAAARCPDLDTARVAIRGWSFGGFLAALAVLRRPDVFHAGIAGAPVTDWRLYDTHYTERYLGHPDDSPKAYERSSLIADAPSLTRPLMIIHGLADDNVVVAHSLRLSQALLAAGRPHTVLPLSGVTHMASQEQVAENLLLLQVDFLRRALGVAPAPARAAAR